MKKNFVQKLALGLALVMTVTSVPATSKAAAKPAFKTSSVTVTEGETVKAVIKNTKGWAAKKVVVKDGTVAEATAVQKAKKVNVKVTGVKAGETVVKAVLKKGDKKVNAKLAVTVTEAKKETGMLSAAQNSTTKLTVTFSEALTSIKASEFAIARTNDNAVVAVKSATIDPEDATKVVVETYAAMADGKEYAVTYNENDTVNFTATDGVVVDVTITPFTVTADKKVKVYAQTLDDENIVVGTYTLTNASSNDVEFTIETTEGYVDGDTLYLAEVGDTAKAKVVYHTWKFDDKGVETGKVEKEFTITAVKDATVISNYDFTISATTPAWDSASFKVNTTIATNDTVMNAYFNIKDSNSDHVENDYKVVSSDPSKLLIDEVTLTNNTTAVNIVGVSAGTAYILLQNEDGDTVRTFAVTVVDGRKAATLEVDAAAFTLSRFAAALDSRTVELTAKDQYGVEMNLATATANITVLSKPTGATAPTPIFTPGSKATIGFTGSAFPMKGAYVYKVELTVPTVGSATPAVVTRTITVNVQDAVSAVASSYALVLTGLDANNSVDLAVKTTDTVATATKSVGFSVATKDSNGVLNGVHTTGITYTVKYSDGTLVSTGAAATLNLTTASGTAISVATAPATPTSQLKAGTYIVTADIDTDLDGTNDKSITKTFTVTDSQVAPTVVIKSTNANGATLAAALAPSTNVTYYYDGTAYDGSTPGITVLGHVSKTAATSVGTEFVQYVTLQFPVKPGLERVITIPVNKTFTNVN